MTDAYPEVISLIERLHRHFLEVVKLELEGLGIPDINNVQGMMLYNIGDAEMTVGELTLRGCYLGSNVSYNVKKMVENGYLAQERSLHDRRPRISRRRERAIDGAPRWLSCGSLGLHLWTGTFDPDAKPQQRGTAEEHLIR